jgi:hypothetical protein
MVNGRRQPKGAGPGPGPVAGAPPPPPAPDTHHFSVSKWQAAFMQANPQATPQQVQTALAAKKAQAVAQRFTVIP